VAGCFLVNLRLKMKPEISVKAKTVNKFNLDFDLDFGLTKTDLKMLSFPLISMIVCFFLLFFLLVPKWKSIGKIAKQSESVKAKRDEFVAKVQTLSTVEESQLKNYYSLASLAVPERKDVSLALFTFSEPARKNGFFLNALSFDLGEIESNQDEEKTITKTKPVGLLSTERITANMSLVGSSQNAGSLFSDLEEGLPLMQIDKLDYVSIRGDIIDIDLVVSFFYSPEKASYKLDNLKISELSLSNDELELLNNLASFDRQEKILESLRLARPSTGSGGRKNPFYLE
jgi:hypothetical protein